MPDVDLVLTINGPTKSVSTLGRALLALNGAFDDLARIQDLPPTTLHLVTYTQSSHILGIAAQAAGGVLQAAGGTLLAKAIISFAAKITGEQRRADAAIDRLTNTARSDSAFASHFRALLDAANDDSAVSDLTFARDIRDASPVVVERGFFRDPHSQLILPFSAETPVVERRKGLHLALDRPAAKADHWFIQWDVGRFRHEQAPAKISDLKLQRMLEEGQLGRGHIIICDLKVQRRRNRETGDLFVAEAEIERFISVARPKP